MVLGKMSQMCSSWLLQQCFVCIVHRIVGGRWPYRCYFVGCCFQDLFNIARSILVQCPSSFFSIRLVSVHVLHPYSRTDTKDKCTQFSNFQVLNKQRRLDVPVKKKINQSIKNRPYKVCHICLDLHIALIFRCGKSPWPNRKRVGLRHHSKRFRTLVT